jgi:hypothetical protein
VRSKVLNPKTLVNEGFLPMLGNWVYTGVHNQWAFVANFNNFNISD